MYMYNMSCTCTAHIHYHNTRTICRAHGTHPVLKDHTIRLSLVEHLLVPVNQPLRFGHLLLFRVTVEDIVISLTRWACPNMGSQKTGGDKKMG